MDRKFKMKQILCAQPHVWVDIRLRKLLKCKCCPFLVKKRNFEWESRAKSPDGGTKSLYRDNNWLRAMENNLQVIVPSSNQGHSDLGLVRCENCHE